MIRGSTPTLTFNLPFATSEIDSGYITFTQHGTIMLDKKISDCECENKSIKVKLSQKETLSLASDTITEMQISIKCGDSVLRSNIMTANTDRI